jgi:flavin reductase (DIM6/NTAB) family NADH-FMN oxidoreductase RutF
VTVPVELQKFRDLMAGVCAPVTIITTAQNEIPHGATVSAFAYLSLDPPMVTVALNRRSQLLTQILQAGRFGVNVLARDQEEVAKRFAQRGVERFGPASWHFDGGMPRLACAATWLVCDLESTVEGGDHILLLGLVEDGQRTDAAPLIYGDRTYGTHTVVFEREAAKVHKAKRLALLGQFSLTGENEG